jgi:hypothetical protein
MTELIKGNIYNELPDEYYENEVNIINKYLPYYTILKPEKYNKDILIFDVEKLVNKYKLDIDIINDFYDLSILDNEDIYKSVVKCVYIESSSNKLPHPLSFINFDSAMDLSILGSNRLINATLADNYYPNIQLTDILASNTLNLFISVIEKKGIDEIINKYLWQRKRVSFSILNRKYDYECIKKANNLDVYKNRINDVRSIYE